MFAQDNHFTPPERPDETNPFHWPDVLKCNQRRLVWDLGLLRRVNIGGQKLRVPVIEAPVQVLDVIQVVLTDWNDVVNVYHCSKYACFSQTKPFSPISERTPENIPLWPRHDLQFPA